MPSKCDKPASPNLDEMKKLESLYEEILAKREGWDKLFDWSAKEPYGSLMALVLDDLPGWGPTAIEALDCYDRKVGDLTGTAASLREAIHAGDRNAVRLAWALFLADPQNKSLAGGALDEFIERAEAITGGEQSGKARRRKRDDNLTKAAKALNKLVGGKPMSEPMDWSLADIAAESGMPLVQLQNLKLRNIRTEAIRLREIKA